MKMIRSSSILALIIALAISVAAQNSGLPRLRKGEAYAKVRTKMIKAGWKPFRAPDSDECVKGDSRCEGRPEMHVCSGTGLGSCEFLWKRRGKTVAIFTVGEEGGNYSSYRFQ
jgi:hypothetical protein